MSEILKQSSARCWWWLGRRQRPFHRPFQLVDTATDFRGRDAGVPRPFGQRLRVAMQRQFARIPFVVALNQSRGPDAVIRAVRPIIVGAFDHVLRRGSWPHVGIERGEVVSPAVAHRDASTAVIWITHTIRVMASLAHLTPHPVFGFTRPVMGVVTFARAVSVQASTRFHLAASQVLGGVRACVSTLTSAEPHPVVVSRSRGSDHGQSAKLLSEQLCWRRHISHYTSRTSRFRVCA